ncbi:protein TAB2, chloroplastic [Sesamum angolense]|uniref:Protein TAB2, chloroplastic n=1 Tax=Sesamum angolense TaxID=2727404 RepID=A0AAE2C6N0_9LAMI|nr:protein TAB2, chloroplastic [Sesamum angolense]
MFKTALLLSLQTQEQFTPPMAALRLSFNSTRITNSNFTSPTKIPFSDFSTPHKNLRNLHFPPPLSVSESSVSSTPLQTQTGQTKIPDDEEEAEADADDDPTAELCYLDPETDPESLTEWEVDFCSRPILDIRGKKIWELVVCDNSLSLQYTKYFPNNVINSVTLKNAIVSICDELGVPLPEKIRFFRSQMQTIITRACNELGVKPIPSKRCVSLLLWLEERYETVYTRHPGFQKGSKPLLSLDNPFPMELPENLYGEKWAFVQLPFSAVQEEVSSFQTRFSFGASLDLDLLGIEVGAKTLVPGLAVASSRAKPLAGWMNGLEVCSLEADTSRACVVLSVGISTRYIYATYKKTPVTTSEAEAWEAAKKACGGLHFLAIQDELDSDDCVGFWLLLDLPPPPV